MSISRGLIRPWYCTGTIVPGRSASALISGSRGAQAIAVEAAQLLSDDALDLGDAQVAEAEERVSQYGVHAREAGNVASAQRGVLVALSQPEMTVELILEAIR